MPARLRPRRPDPLPKIGADQRVRIRVASTAFFGRLGRSANNHGGLARVEWFQRSRSGSRRCSFGPWSQRRYRPKDPLAERVPQSTALPCAPHLPTSTRTAERGKSGPSAVAPRSRHLASPAAPAYDARRTLCAWWRCYERRVPSWSRFVARGNPDPLSRSEPGRLADRADEMGARLASGLCPCGDHDGIAAD